MLFSHTPGVTRAAGLTQPPRSLERFKNVRTSLDNDDMNVEMKQAFDAFLGKVASGMAEKSKAEMEASLQSAETGGR